MAAWSAMNLRRGLLAAATVTMLVAGCSNVVAGRAVIDVLCINGAVAHVDDHKTGKNRKKDMQQLIIFALMVFYHHPEVNAVHTAFHWVQHGFDEAGKDRETFYRHQIPDLWETLVPKLQRYKAAFLTQLPLDKEL